MPERSDVELAQHIGTLEERIRRLEVDLSIFATQPKSIPIGGGFTVVEGAGSRLGTATLVAGTVTVPSTAVTGRSRIFLCGQVTGVTGALRVSARTAGVSFDITSSAADNGLVAWLIVEPT